MIAWRQEDGRYTLIAQSRSDVEVLRRLNPSPGQPGAPGGVAPALIDTLIAQDWSGFRVLRKVNPSPDPIELGGVAPELIDQLEVLRIVGVIHESVCCDHAAGRSLQFSLTSEARARTGWLWFASCPDCGGLVCQAVPIIENLGELPDCCRLWEEEFAPRTRGEA